MSDLISVIVPVYNNEKFIDKCIASIVNQTYPNLEIIIVDDGSVDNTPAICDAWADKDSRIRVIHKENGGVSSAKDLGVRNAMGEYIGFVDSDDWIDKDMYTVLAELIACNGADIACCGIVQEYFDREGVNVYDKDFLLHGEDIMKSYISDVFITPENANKLYKKQLFADVSFSSGIAYAEDFLVNYYLLKQCRCVAGTARCLYHYLQDSGNSSTTAVITHARANSYKIFEKIVLENKNSSLYDSAVKRFTNAAFAVLSRVMLCDDFCKEYYDPITDTLLKYKKDILKNKSISMRHRLMIFVMSLNKNLFRFITNKIRN